MLKDTVFCHLPENLLINLVRKLMNSATNIGKDAAKTASKRVVPKTAEAAGDKTADKISLAGISKVDNKTKKVEKIYIPPEKRQQIIDDLRLF